MSYDDAIITLCHDALKFVKDGSVIGLGSGRAATILVELLSEFVSAKNYRIVGVPTSLQIKLVAEKNGIVIIDAEQVDHIDVVFDGADQISESKYLIKGGGGALLRENILFNLAKKIVILADKTKFVKDLTKAVPVEIHPQARSLVGKAITKIGGNPTLRLLDRGYPFFTENRNIILDCDFGTIKEPKKLTQMIKQIPGVMESGIFLKKPNVIYKAQANGEFDVL